MANMTMQQIEQWTNPKYHQIIRDRRTANSDTPESAPLTGYDILINGCDLMCNPDFWVRIIYANHGMLGHEYEPVYTDTPAVESGMYDELSVSLPAGWDWGESVDGRLLICSPDDVRYYVDEIIMHVDGQPCLCWYDDTGRHIAAL